MTPEPEAPSAQNCDQPASGATPEGGAPGKILSPEALRALEEAAQRRRGQAVAQGPAAADAPTELGGPKGAEPTRFGDWERKGVCYDF